MGKQIEIPDTMERVTGTLKYIDDIKLIDHLYGKFIRSSSASAEIKKINCDEAKKVPGIIGIYTYLDFPDGVPKYGPITADQPILADRIVRYYGEPVVLIIAESQVKAEVAASLIEIVYSKLEAVIDIRTALLPDSPLVNCDSDSNINTVFHNGWGDCKKAKTESDIVISNEYYMPHVHHNAMENYTCISEPDHGGVLITTAIQSPFQLRRIIADMLQIPFSKVQINGKELGGGFGGRGYPKAEPAAAYFAFKLKRSVKIKLTAEEGFLVGQRESARIRISNGFSNEGLMLFQEIAADFGNGAYLDISPRVVNKAGMLGTGAYKIENVEVTFRGIYTNTTPTTAYRGFGAAHVCFAIESQIEEAARKLGISSIEIRLKNLPDKGECFIPNEKPADGDWRECLKTAVKLSDFYNKPAGNRVKTLAIGIKNSIAATTSFSRIKINSDGSANVYIGTSEMGQGSRAVAAKYVNRFLGIELNKIHVVNANTEAVPFDFITASSRSTVSMGIAIRDACSNLKKSLFEIVRHNYKETPVEIKDAFVKTAEGNFLSFENILETEYGPNMGEIEASGIFKARKDLQNLLGGPCIFYEVVVSVIEASVDSETGEIQIFSMINVSDAGKLINPVRAAGVDEGGAVMGLGAALMESLVYDKLGILKNGSSLDYRIPTVMDIPLKMTSHFIENRDGPGPGGEKGIGEGAILAIAPAVKEAIYQCTGIDIKELPFTSEKIWRHLKMSGIKIGMEDFMSSVIENESAEVDNEKVGFIGRMKRSGPAWMAAGD